jgi:hypothetical protein
MKARAKVSKGKREREKAGEGRKFPKKGTSFIWLSPVLF